ncbi:MAG TPA: AMP-binding protein, partial [Thermoleophilaceae bacterium]|nr:AMP-binding protein [Thermoleophilaceae bacterium]
MESATQARTHRPRGLDADTMTAAFQITAEDNADTPAIRTKDDEFTITWAEYAQRLESVARGLAALGLQHGDTIGLMLTNRPEFHLTDTAALHLGAVPFSIYNTYTA